MGRSNGKAGIIIGFFAIMTGLLIFMVYLINRANAVEPPPETNETEDNMTLEDKRISLDYRIIRATNNYYNNNYLISPLDVGYSLKILEEGSSGKTKTQITKFLNNYNFTNMVNINNKVSMSNALFINTSYKTQVSNEFSSTIASKYNANMMFDSFGNTDSINTWINGKMFNLLPRAIGRVTSNSVMDTVSAVALNIDWKQKMSSTLTHTGQFRKIDNTLIEVAYMKDTNGFGYVENDIAKGIVKHYSPIDLETDPMTGTPTSRLELEYIAIQPKINLNQYISSLDQYELSKLLSTVRTHSATEDLVMNIPKYNYDFTYDALKSVLMEKGLTRVFEEDADFKPISKSAKLYVTDMIHKTYIDFGENGTYSAPVYTGKAVTEKESEKTQTVIDFNTPFIYLIKEKNNTNIWLFGVVYEPTTWEYYSKLIEDAKKEEERAKRGW